MLPIGNPHWSPQSWNSGDKCRQFHSRDRRRAAHPNTAFKGLFAGLTRREAVALTATQAIYHRRHPFRTALFVDLDSHELPELPECRSVTHLAEATCPC